jgi:nucleotide-binding universal stress UspA family protein
MAHPLLSYHREGPYGEVRTMKVILAIDGSPHSHAALVEFAKQPWPTGTEVQILTVIHSSIPLLMEPTLVVAAAHVQQAGELRHQAPALVEAASKLIRETAPAVTVTTKIMEGVPKDMIVQEANDWGADLIVMGSHGQGRVRRMVLGSVASAVVAKAPCSVQVFRAKHLLHNTESAA